MTHGSWLEYWFILYIMAGFTLICLCGGIGILLDKSGDVTYKFLGAFLLFMAGGGLFMVYGAYMNVPKG